MRRSLQLRLLKVSLGSLIVIATLLLWLTSTSAGSRLRYLAADTLISTQHREWAKWFIGEREMVKRMAEYDHRFDEMAQETLLPVLVTKPALLQENSVPKPPLIRVEDVSGNGWSGKLLIVSDPLSIRIGVPGQVGRGETVSSMLVRLGAVAGVNGGAFSDPNWSGNGFQPVGLVMTGGEIYYNDALPEEKIDVVGFSADGALIAGQYTLEELERLELREAVSFRPRLIVNGKGLVESREDGWGIAPRTAIAQTGDGTVLFAIIDGRQPHSVGATLYDVQQLFLDRGAVVAANLDGGASTELVVKKQHTRTGYEIVNKPATTLGERSIPTAFLVFEFPQAARIDNVWQGIDWDRYDPLK